ncbi:DUF2218 domain-containing protein [Peterkaempfera sp. SMS 1(5)a]|uniref:DUF2218 domain-containing protein n=1 Tax=Peterkaempfera podocarpi TaxID=3232308 RepID=UPI00366CA15E
MPTAEAHVATGRGSRYLTQLCRHLDRMSLMNHQPGTAPHAGHTPPQVQHVDYSDTHGVVRFAEGRWTLHATPDTLTLRVEADDEQTLQRLRDAATARLEKIGRRDRLTVTWNPSAEPLGDAGGTASAAGVRPGRHRGHGRTLGVAAVAAAVIGLHLGLGGAALAASAWTGLAADAVLAVVALKVVLMGGHIALGRLAVRRGRSVGLPWTRRRTPSE